MVNRLGILLLLALPLLCSCKHKDFQHETYDLERVMISFDFGSLAHKPTAMRLLCYPAETGTNPYMFDLSGDGGYVRLPKGHYNILAYNVDTENVLATGTSAWDDFMLTTPSTEPQVEMAPANASSFRAMRVIHGELLPMNDSEANIPLYDAPEWTCVAKLTDVAVPLSQTDSRILTDDDGNHVLNMPAEEAVMNVNITISGINGLSRAAVAQGSLSGVAAGSYPTLGHASSDPALIIFNTRINSAAGIITANFCVWALQPYDNIDSRQMMNLYIWANSGNYYTTFDVTDQFLAYAGQHQANASIDLKLSTEIDITQGATGDSGFNPSVNGWEVVNQGIHM